MTAPDISRTPYTIQIYWILSWLIGWWQVYDGLHQRLFDDFARINGAAGPWTAMVDLIGLHPADMGWALIMVGFIFIGTSFGLYLRQRWAYTMALVAVGVSLPYWGWGTLVIVACLVVLVLKPTRVYLAAGK